MKTALFSFLLLLTANCGGELAHAAFKVGGMTWVTTDGTAGQCMVTNGSAQLGWSSVLTPSALSATAPVTYNSSTKVIAMPVATSSVNGYLSSTDWSTFNAKQPAGSYVTSLTGDVTASGPGASAATVAKIQGTTVTGTTGGGNVMFSASPTTTGTLTAAAISASGAISASNFSGSSSGSNTGDQTIALTGDVTGTGVGSFAATVAAVGGSTAANVHAAELAANAATSSNTASTIVKRNSSGEVSIGTVFADLVSSTSGLLTNLGVGGAVNTARAISITNTALTTNAQVGIHVAPVFNSTATVNGVGLEVTTGTAASAFTLGTAYDLYIGNIVKGAGSAVTLQYGIYIDSLTSGVTNWGLYDLAAQNYMAGTLAVGGTTAATILDVNGDITQRNGGGVIIGSSKNDAGLFSFEASGNVNGTEISAPGATQYVTVFTNGAERMRVNASGDLGLGTSGPTHSSGFATASLNGSTGGQIAFQTSGTPGSYIFSDSANGLHYTASGNGIASIDYQTGSNPAIAVTNNTGAVSMPALAASSAPATGSVCWTTGGNLTVDTTLACLASTRKIKQDITPIESGLNTVLALEPISYDLKAKYNPMHLGRQVGFIAEDVAKVDPRLVGKDSKGRIQGVRYMQLTSILTKAIQEQQEQIDELKSEIRRLRNGR